ncbi:MAG: DNA mismatch repair endonuclease MutL [SAR324 cluster bacterium]|nr:DNA mismatch repair endonuclease MutL [SAR324 cluster bacterium]
MGLIRVLPEQVINKIAAGEVVERPASVVKELAENALDAGATQISLTLKDGGRDYISVLDNGSGMDEADARIAVQRHATSKIRDEEGLATVQTLGFRGEALASIAAVSRFELVTCADAETGGTRIALEGGQEKFVGREGFPRGTRVTVEELFFNTPARRKFLRTAATEFQHIQSIFTNLALAHPGVHFRLAHNQKVVSDLPGCEALVERVQQLFGAQLAEELVGVEGAEASLSFEALLSGPSHSKSSRRWQFLFINGRPIRNPSINHAVYQAYRTLLMKERHPAFVLKLQLEPGEVDVNVHPAKTEVRLRNLQWVHTVLADKLHKGLMDTSRRRAFGGAQTPAGGATHGEGPAHLLPAARGFQGEFPLAAARAEEQVKEPVAPPSPAATGISGEEPPSARLEANPFLAEGFTFQPLSPRGDGEETTAPRGLADQLAVVGQLHATYLLVQRAGSLMVVDQHAAHERILFEQYRRQFYQGRVVTEAYLIPPSLELSAQNALLLEQYLPQWSRMGFEIEPFGKATYLIRQVPALITGKDVKVLVLEVLDELALFGKSGRLEEVFNEILERVACHAALRAGRHLSWEEMEALVSQLERLDINLYCPHGRPVMIEFPLRELEKRFKRIV